MLKEFEVIPSGKQEMSVQGSGWHFSFKNKYFENNLMFNYICIILKNKIIGGKWLAFFNFIILADSS